MGLGQTYCVGPACGLRGSVRKGVGGNTCPERAVNRHLTSVTTLELTQTKGIQLFNRNIALREFRLRYRCNVISAQCFECQRGEIQPSSGKQRE